MTRGETFRWRERVYDVDALLGDLAAGALRPTFVELKTPFIVEYCTLYLDPTFEPRPPIQIDKQYAETLSQERLNVPLVLLHVGEGQGVVSMSEDAPEAHYVVADGNHRFVAAQRLRRTLHAYVLSPAESLRYELSANGVADAQPLR